MQLLPVIGFVANLQQRMICERMTCRQWKECNVCESSCNMQQRVTCRQETSARRAVTEMSVMSMTLIAKMQHAVMKQVQGRVHATPHDMLVRTMPRVNEIQHVYLATMQHSMPRVRQQDMRM